MSGQLALSAISLWEIAWLAENKKIDIDVSVESFVKKYRFLGLFRNPARPLGRARRTCQSPRFSLPLTIRRTSTRSR